MSENRSLSSRLMTVVACAPLVSRVLARTAHHVDPWLLRLTRGRWFVASLIGLSPVMLATTGARSGRRRALPLAAMRDGDRLVLVASNFGQARYPAWYHNLRAHPEAEVTSGGRTRAYVAHEVFGEERERLWRRIVALYPCYAVYAERVAARRRVPLMVLAPLPHEQAG